MVGYSVVGSFIKISSIAFSGSKTRSAERNRDNSVILHLIFNIGLNMFKSGWPRYYERQQEICAPPSRTRSGRQPHTNAHFTAHEHAINIIEISKFLFRSRVIGWKGDFWGSVFGAGKYFWFDISK